MKVNRLLKIDSLKFQIFFKLMCLFFVLSLQFDKKNINRFINRDDSRAG